MSSWFLLLEWGVVEVGVCFWFSSLPSVFSTLLLDLWFRFLAAVVTAFCLSFACSVRIYLFVLLYRIVCQKGRVFFLWFMC